MSDTKPPRAPGKTGELIKRALNSAIAYELGWIDAHKRIDDPDTNKVRKETEVFIRRMQAYRRRRFQAGPAR